MSLPLKEDFVKNRVERKITEFNFGSNYFLIIGGIDMHKLSQYSQFHQLQRMILLSDY